MSWWNVARNGLGQYTDGDCNMAFAKEDEVVAGTKLVVDGRFNCMREGEVLKVKKSREEELFVNCSVGRHYIHSQLNETNEYIGLTLYKEEK